MTTGVRGIPRAGGSASHKHLRAHIAGWHADSQQPAIEIHNPADTRELVAVAARNVAEDVEAALAVAHRAAPGWAATPVGERGEILGRAADVMALRKDDIAVDMTREMGKILRESHAEVQRAIDVLRFFSQAPKLQHGASFPLGSNESAFTMRVPLGVVGLITPWNFPLAIPTWKAAAALAYGNVVVLKPAEIAPVSATALVECLLEGGLPPETLSLVLGSGTVLGPALVDSPISSGISFTGSTPVGLGIARRLAGTETVVQSEMGGRNAIVVLADADLDQAVTTAVLAGFGTTGQRCTACSRVIVERAVAEDFVERLLNATRKLRVGPGLDPASDVGPLVSAQQRDEVLDTLLRATTDGTEVLYGGNPLTAGNFAHGHFMQPTVTRSHGDSWFAQHEVFGPVVSVFEAEGFDDAVRLNNAVPYGLTSGIFTRSLEYAMRFVHETDTGMVHINRPTVGAEAHIPFGGAKESSVGPPEMGGAWQFYTKNRSAHVRWR